MRHAPQALVKGLPDWDYNGRLWLPLAEAEGWEEAVDDKTGEKIQHVHIVTKITGVYSPARVEKAGGKVIGAPEEMKRVAATTRDIYKAGAYADKGLREISGGIGCTARCGPSAHKRG